MSRVRKYVGAGCVIALAGALLAPRVLPDGGEAEPRGTLVTSGRLGAVAATTAGPGEVTATMRAEIDRVIDAAPAVGRRASVGTLADALVRCATFEEQQYCLYAGWTDQSPHVLRQRYAAPARPAAETTGDLDSVAALRRAAAMSTAERERVERRELTEAARSVAKVVLLRHQLEGTALPAGFLDRHPEARASATTARATVKSRGDYPRRGTVMRSKRVREQTRTWWCGPATMQMIAWGWQGEPRPQRHWARRLGTTGDGTAISDMVRVTNRATGYDRDSRAGSYIVLDISDWSFDRWLLLQMRHVVDYRAPLVLHPILLRRFYPYLDDDASGHFQVGRGYDKRGTKPTQLGYFEPWNQQRFDPSEPYVARVQWRSAYKSFRANKAHPHQNIGV